MRPILLVLALALLVTSAVAAKSRPAATPLAQAQVTSEALPTPAHSTDLDEACSATAGGDALPNLCPYDSPICVEHDDCDDYCGSPEFGYCDIQGFFPTGCCLCLG